jgi:hypothetical protein
MVFKTHKSYSYSYQVSPVERKLNLSLSLSLFSLSLSLSGSISPLEIFWMDDKMIMKYLILLPGYA